MNDLEKFNWIRENLWDGSLKELASILGVSNVYLSAVGSGKNEFNDKLKSKILKNFKNVNPKWLFLGEGEPLLAEQSNEDNESYAQIYEELKLRRAENENLRAIIMQQNEIIKMLAKH